MGARSQRGRFSLIPPLLICGEVGGIYQTKGALSDKCAEIMEKVGEIEVSYTDTLDCRLEELILDRGSGYWLGWWII